MAFLLGIVGLLLGLPVVLEFFATGLVPRLPTAVLAVAFVFLCGLSLATGLVLDNVAKTERKEWELHVYWSFQDQRARAVRSNKAGE